MKKFNDFLNENSISDVSKNKDLQEQIDEILDNLSKNKGLSKSEKEFMEEASNDTVTQITVPSPNVSMQQLMTNPHAGMTLWVGKDGRWKELISYDEAIDEDDEDDSDKQYERERKEGQEKFAEQIPGLKEILNEYAKDVLKFNDISYEVEQKLRQLGEKYLKDDYQYSTKIDYATNGTLDSLLNQFYYIIDTIEEDNNAIFGYKIKKKK